MPSTTPSAQWFPAHELKDQETNLCRQADAPPLPPFEQEQLQGPERRLNAEEPAGVERGKDPSRPKGDWDLARLRMLPRSVPAEPLRGAGRWWRDVKTRRQAGLTIQLQDHCFYDKMSTVT